MDQVVQIVLSYAGAHPYVMTILAVIGGLRVLLKPVFSLAHTYVDFTPDASDNAALDKVEQSSIVKGLFYVLDWMFSVKIIK